MTTGFKCIGTHKLSMGSTTITIRDDVYEKLSNIKEDKSFSELLEVLAEMRRPDRNSFGAWKGRKEELEESIEEGREKLERDFEERK